MYSRFKALENFSEKELEKLQNSKVAVVGLGATGSVIAEHLARHSVELLLVDRDYLEENDVYSSMVYTPEQCQNSMPKAVAAEEYLSQFTEVESAVESIHPGNISMLDDVDLILDGTDNMKTRFLLNEYSKKTGTPWIYTAALAEQGFSMLFNSECFNCVFEQVSAGELETCETAGVLREVSTRAASKSAETAVKYLTGKDVEEKLWRADGQTFNVETTGCKVCENGEFAELESSRGVEAVCGENKYQVQVEFNEDVLESLREAGKVKAENDYLTRVEVKGREIVLFRSGRAIVQAEDRGHAESVFSEVVGL